MFGDGTGVVIKTLDNAPVKATMWMRAEPIALKEDTERLELAPGIWIVRYRQWLPVSVLDSAELLPWDADAEPVRRTFPYPAWHDLAACNGVEDAPKVFFGPEDDARGTRFMLAARICQSCVVKTDCLTHALTQPEEFGVWGGVTGRQRAKLQARLRSGETVQEVVETWLAS